MSWQYSNRRGTLEDRLRGAVRAHTGEFPFLSSSSIYRLDNVPYPSTFRDGRCSNPCDPHAEDREPSLLPVVLASDRQEVTIGLEIKCPLLLLPRAQGSELVGQFFTHNHTIHSHSRDRTTQSEMLAR
jgi:hypothetical protein